jgi:cytochrome c biogenesis protein CcmG/thiol:disulfide interchange protein DsbE
MTRWTLRWWGVALLAASAAGAQTSIVADVRAAIGRNDLAAATTLVQAFRAERGTTPEALEALSWVGRGRLAAGDNAGATTVAQDVERSVIVMLANRSLDADTHLPVAMGAALETEAKAMAADGNRAGAVGFLRQQIVRYRATSIRGRLQKNLNLLSLEGEPAPALTAKEHLGAPMPDTRNRPVVLFFWAHWCSDCKAEAPIIAQLEAEYRKQGLLVIGPTRHYGYTARGAAATPAQELAYIDTVRQQYYGMIREMAVPVSDEDALGYGMDATPTIVLVDRQGKVALYHPGQMTRQELEPYIQKLVGAK